MSRIIRTSPLRTLLFVSLAVWATPGLSLAQFSAFAQTPPQIAEAAALDAVCFVSAVGPLIAQCTDFDNALGNGNENLTLQQTGHEDYSVQGTLATEANDRQLVEVGNRLADLRSEKPADEDDGSIKLLGRLGGFLTTHGNIGEFDGSSRENAFDFHNEGATAGLDYRINEETVAGAAITYTRSSSDFDNTGLASGGDFDFQSYGGSLYATLQREGYYVQGVLGYSRGDHETKRRMVSQTLAYPLNATARGETDSDAYAGQLTGGSVIQRGRFTIEPQVALGYRFTRIERFTESGATGLERRLSAQNIQSLQSRIGAQVSRTVSMKFGVLRPYIEAAWLHEYLDEERDLKGTFIFDAASTAIRPETDAPDRDYVRAGAGVSAVLRRGLQLFVEYQTVLGLQDVENHVLRTGVRGEF